jgi:hypothetical protein
MSAETPFIACLRDVSPQTCQPAAALDVSSRSHHRRGEGEHRAGVPRSSSMKMTGHKTESIYRRHAIVDEVMLREGGEKLAAHHSGVKTVKRTVTRLKSHNRTMR